MAVLVNYFKCDSIWIKNVGHQDLWVVLPSFISTPSSGWPRMGRRTEEGSLESDERLKSFSYSCESNIKFLRMLLSLAVLHSFRSKAIHAGAGGKEGTVSVYIPTPMLRLLWRQGGSAGLFTTQIRFRS